MPLATCVWGLVAFHVAQLIGIASTTWLAGTALSRVPAALSRCGSMSAVLWAPAWEELVFRYVVFYLVLHRSRGNVPFAAASSALAFAAVHMGKWAVGPRGASHTLSLVRLPSFASSSGNILAPGSEAATSVVFAVLQCSVAVVCGLAYALAFAATGSLGAVTLLHALNNAVAVAWLSFSGEAGAGSDAGDAAVCETRWSPAFAGALLATLAAYALAAAAAYSAVGRLTAASVAGPQAVAATGQASPPLFADMHGLVFGDGSMREVGAEAAPLGDSPAPLAVTASPRATGAGSSGAVHRGPPLAPPGPKSR